MEKKTIEQWINQGRKNCKSFVFYENKVLDLSQFMLEHPGGIKAIKNYLYKDITNIIFQVYPHNKDTVLTKLMKYCVGIIPEQEVTSKKQKADKSLNSTQKPREKKIVCFIADNQKMMSSKGGRSKSKDRMSKSMNRSKHNSVSKGKQNKMRESKSKNTASRKVQMSKSKSKKAQFLTSIRVINQNQKKTYNDYFEQNKQKNRQKQRATTQKRRDEKQKNAGSCSFLNNQLDEQKPQFKVPVLAVKHMYRNS